MPGPVRSCHSIVDPYSFQPDFKSTPVAISPEPVQSAGFLLARRRIPLPRTSTWAWRAIAGGYTTKIDTAGDGTYILEALKQSVGSAHELVRYEDVKQGLRRYALLVENRLIGALFLAPSDVAPKWGILEEAWNLDTIDRAVRKVLLSGQRLDGAVYEGPNVCACFGVPEGRINAAISAGAVTAAAIGAALKAGTNCGSCIPELKRLIIEQSERAASPAQKSAS